MEKKTDFWSVVGRPTHSYERREERSCARQLDDISAEFGAEDSVQLGQKELPSPDTGNVYASTEEDLFWRSGNTLDRLSYPIGLDYWHQTPHCASSVSTATPSPYFGFDLESPRERERLVYSPITPSDFALEYPRERERSTHGATPSDFEELPPLEYRLLIPKLFEKSTPHLSRYSSTAVSDTPIRKSYSPLPLGQTLSETSEPEYSRNFKEQAKSTRRRGRPHLSETSEPEYSRNFKEQAKSTRRRGRPHSASSKARHLATHSPCNFSSPDFATGGKLKRPPAPELFVKPKLWLSPTKARSSISVRKSLVVKLRLGNKEYLQSLKNTGYLQPSWLHLAALSFQLKQPKVKSTYPKVLTRTEILDTLYPGYLEGEMAPGYRTQNRRQNRTGYVDHDVFEGLPVRQWRRDYVTVAPAPSQENTAVQNDIWAVELPHGMPKDSHLLPQHSQDLLRAARSGRIYKRPAPTEEEEIDPDAALIEKQDKKDDDPKDRGFQSRAWKQIPRNSEGPELEYLAKRRKGLITYTKPAPPVPTVTKTTVRRTDAAGNQYTQDVVVPHGQQVDGEVISQTIIPDPNAVPAVTSLPLQATPPKKKPIIRKKAKGPGRGRKKKILPPTSIPQPETVNGVAPIGEIPASGVVPEVINIDGSATPAPTTNEDTELGDGSVAASDEEDEEGEEGDDDEGSVTDQNSPPKFFKGVSLSPKLASVPITKDIPDIAPLAPGGPLLPFPAHLEKEKAGGKTGSPLKNVALTTSTLNSPLPSPTTPTIIAPTIPAGLGTNSAFPSLTNPVNIDEDTMMSDSTDVLASDLAPPLPQPTIFELSAAVELRQVEEEEEKMLLDTLRIKQNGETEDGTLLRSLNNRQEEAEEDENLVDLLDNTNDYFLDEGKEDSLAIPEVTSQELETTSAPVLEAPIVRESIVEIPIVEMLFVEMLREEEETMEAQAVEVPIMEAAAISENPILEEPKLPASMNTPEQEMLATPVPRDAQEEPTQDEAKQALSEPTLEESVQDKPAQEEPPPQVDDDDEDDDSFLDLLGGLEKSLNQPPPPAPVPKPAEQPSEK